MIVRLNQVEEFCDELRREEGNIERRIVRVTNLYTQSKMAISIKHVQVIVTFLVCAFAHAWPPAEAQIVRLERYCGDIWGIHEQDQPVLDRAASATKKIEEVCQELGLEIRPGIIEYDKFERHQN